MNGTGFEALDTVNVPSRKTYVFRVAANGIPKLAIIVRNGVINHTRNACIKFSIKLLC